MPIYWETNFQPLEFPRSGSKAKDGEIDKERLTDGNNNGQLRIATPPRVAHAKPPGPIVTLIAHAIQHMHLFVSV